MKSKFSLKTQFKEAKKFVRESSKHIFISVLIFALAGIFGFVYRSQLSIIDELLKRIILETQNLNMIETIFFILQNNLQSALFAVLFGIFFGIFPILSTLSNGTIVGYVLGKSYDLSGISEFWRLLPHGIFELPAIFISIGMGLKLGLILLKKNRTTNLKNNLYKAMNAFLLIVIPLLIIASVIEGILVSLLS